MLPLHHGPCVTARRASRLPPRAGRTSERRGKRESSPHARTAWASVREPERASASGGKPGTALDESDESLGARGFECGSTERRGGRRSGAAPGPRWRWRRSGKRSGRGGRGSGSSLGNASRAGNHRRGGLSRGWSVRQPRLDVPCGAGWSRSGSDAPPIGIRRRRPLGCERARNIERCRRGSKEGADPAEERRPPARGAKAPA